MLSTLLRRIAWRVTPRVIRIVATILWRLRIDLGNGFPDPPFVIAANHYSFLDPPMVGAAYGRRLRFLTLSDLFGNYRLLDVALNTFEVIRVRRGTVALSAIRAGLEHLREGGVVAVFPEGTRAGRFGDQPLALGAAWLAAKAKVPIVPMAILGTEQVLGLDNRLRRGRITVAVGPTLWPAGTGRAAVAELSELWAAWIRPRLGSGGAL